ncbi:MAG: type II toxin-antitoxin system YafQ family toxin [Candidatus Adiutrix sp.]|jgi:mRNA interferase YafQ|nr:type II toxin-antitoxin system YafQ family toxin [Candidatus Adiutrix sp.]
MRTIKRAGQFKADFKAARANPRQAPALDTALMTAVSLLAADQPLPERYRDHELVGDWKGHRECHIKPDLLLIYSKPSDDALWLVRIGSHSRLFK